MIRRIWIIVLFMFLLTACGNNVENWGSGDIMFVNDSHVPVSSVIVSCDRETQGGQHADGSPMRKGDGLSFEMVDTPSLVTAYGQEGEELAVCTILEEVPGRWIIRLTCDKSGVLSLNAVQE